ncbi:MAG: exodeoxyribonuclease V subunit alpha [Burkholderiaceae bacterium]
MSGPPAMPAPGSIAGHRLAQEAGAAVRRWHLAEGGRAADADAVAAAMVALWRAVADGAVSGSLADLLATIRQAIPNLQEGTLHDALSASPVIATASARPCVAGTGTATGVRPLVLDAGRLYRWQDWRGETALARGLRALAAQTLDAGRVEPAGSPAGDDADTLNEQQRSAVRRARSHRLLVLSGGPGTGKSHTLAAIVADLLAHQPHLRIVLTAPTGKAAARLSELLAQRQGLPDTLRVMTLHRLLGYRGQGRFEHDASNPLADDLVVVDECSMVDSRLASQLVQSVGPGTRLVLAGDQHQLASVEAGAFFSALCQAPQPDLAAARVLLTRNYRQQQAPGLLRFAEAVREGTVPDLAGRTMPDLVRVIPAEPVANGRWPASLVAQLVDDAVAALTPLFARSRQAMTSADAAQWLDELGAVRVLSALRSGPAGAEALNRQIIARLPGAQAAAGAWFAGRLVAIERNAPGLSLFNGDIGLSVNTAEGLRVVFRRPGRLRSLPPLQLPDCRDAFALTIHQAQGSEFEEVLLLPAPAGHPLATREALYTGATRARQRLRLYCDDEAIAAAVASPGREQSGLLGRLYRL